MSGPRWPSQGRRKGGFSFSFVFLPEKPSPMFHHIFGILLLRRARISPPALLSRLSSFLDLSFSLSLSLPKPLSLSLSLPPSASFSLSPQCNHK